MQIRAAVLEEFANPLVIQNVELEGPKPGEVLVRRSRGALSATRA